jgi:hypothetical protein
LPVWFVCAGIVANDPTNAQHRFSEYRGQARVPVPPVQSTIRNYQARVAD